MDNKDIWISPDEGIKKVVLMCGESGIKPTQNAECVINIFDTIYCVTKYNCSSVIIGNSSDEFEELLDIVLTTMNKGERAKIFMHLGQGDIDFIIELKSFKLDGFIFEWSAKKKFELAYKHKESGIDLFKKMKYVNASHQFSQAIKLLAAIPIPTDDPPESVDGLFVKEIYDLKSNLYNNLASCHVKHGQYDHSIKLCKNVLQRHHNNVKAMYKLAISYYEVHDYHKALETLQNLLKCDPNNQAAAKKLKGFVQKVNESNAKANAMIKKMFI